MVIRSHVLLLLIAGFAGLASNTRADDFDTARNNRLVQLAGPASFSTSDSAIAAQLSAINTAANSDWQSMETGTSRTELWADLPFPSNDNAALTAHITSTYGRLKAMALAYATYGTTLNGNSSLLAAIIDGLTWMNANEYSSTTTWSGIGNWWDWQIGAPLALNDTMVLLYPQLTSDQISTWVGAIRHFLNSPGGTGANLMWESEIVSLSGVLIKDSAQVNKGVSSAPTVLTPVTSGDGFYADGSFIQHTAPGFAYTGGYGLALIADFTNFAGVYAATQWAVPSSTISTLDSYLFKSFQPFIYKGNMMDDVRGREISRWSETSHSDGGKAVAAFLQAIALSSSQNAAQLRSAAKYWLPYLSQNADPNEAYQNSIQTILQAEAVQGDSSVTAMAEPTGFKLFSSMDRVVHLRPGWGASVSMFSSRLGDYESINGENLKGWHTGDGMLYLYNADLQQYSQNYWPTENQYLQEGTTIEIPVSQASGTRSSQAFVGGVPSWDGSYGAAVMAIAPPSRPLTGKKAWFFLDDQIVCLGADITSSGSSQVDTVIANRKLTSAGTNTVTSSNGTSSQSPQAEPATWYTSSSPVQYLHIAGNVSGSDLGYYFPTPVTLEVKREARSDAWSEINQSPTYINHNATYTNNYYVAVINHGTTPSQASYAYVVLPNITAAAVASYATAPEATILENSPSAQAILDPKLGATAAIFWQAQSHTVGSGADSLTLDSPAAVFVTNRNGNLEINVTDPTQTNTGTVNLSLGRSALSLIDSSPAVTVTQLSPTVELAINVSGLKGQPASARLNLSASGLFVVDDAVNSGESTVSSTGTWSSSKAVAGYYGTDYVHDGNTAKGSKTFTFTPLIPSAGSYDIQIRYTSDTNRATNVPVTITSSDGQKTILIDETSGGGTWVSLGAYNFAAGTSGSVTISNAGTQGYVVADAIRLIAR